VPVDLAKIKAQRFACLSGAVSFAEILIVWGGVGVAFALPTWNFHWLGAVFHYTVMVGFLSSTVLAIVGLFRDEERSLAALALVLGFTAGIICSVPLSV
jgi:hypothetical protein